MVDNGVSEHLVVELDDIQRFSRSHVHFADDFFVQRFVVGVSKLVFIFDLHKLEIYLFFLAVNVD